jgi:hypothetical protein
MAGSLGYFISASAANLLLSFATLFAIALSFQFDDLGVVD